MKTLSDEAAGGSVEPATLRVLTLSADWPSVNAPQSFLEDEERMRALRRRAGVEVRVISPAPWGPPWRDPAIRLPALEKRAEMVLHHPSAPRDLLPVRALDNALYAAALARFGRRLRRTHGRYDVIDAHSFEPDGIGAEGLARALDAPFVVTARRSAEELAALSGTARAETLAIAESARAVFALGPAQAAALAGLGADASKIVVTRNGVDMTRYAGALDPAARREARQTFGLATEGALAAVFTGERRDEGDVGIAIEALALENDVQVALFGDRAEPEGALAEAARARLGLRLAALGSLRPDRAAALLGACDFTVYARARPSSWPCGLLESLACGAPVAATPSASVIEVMGLAAGGAPGPAGAVAADASASALGAAIAALRGAQLTPGQARVHAARFDWDAPADQIAETFRKAARAAV